ncbi:MAG TPA: TRAP transporter large permease [Burkholderiaceae bacterium]|nr:TRAP transporter large permease [Burkholderiaceae bacterium]HRA78169.1 TRAP transporter large permease [Burkholderiaceae bacterium]
MTAWSAALYGFGSLAVLLLAGVPIAFAMIMVGVAGTVAVIGLDPALALLGQIPVSQTTSYELSVVPMFILMGTFVARSGIASDLYDACNAMVGHRRGGLAMATIVACGGFAAVCGSAIATAATFARVAHPSMRRFGYDEGLAAAAICAGGTLGILIPPSVIMVIYGVMTGTDVAKLFIAGLVPGVLAIALYMLTVQLIVWRNPAAGPRGERVPSAQALAALGRVWPVLVLFALVIGGLYFGAFTATEGGAIGAAGAFFFALWRGRLSWRVILDCAIDTARTTGSLFAILIGALLFSQFMNFAGLPSALKDAVTAFGVEPLLVIFMILLLYLVLGTFFEELSMILLTVPIFFPLVVGLGFDPIWFGVVVVMVVELGMISPPVGMNLFVVQNMLRTPITTLWRWIAPFVAADVLRLAIVVLVPQIVLFLPGLMK